MPGFYGQWFESWYGDWHGPQDQPAGAISGTASISLSASGVLVNGSNVVPITGGATRPRIQHLPTWIPAPRRPRDEVEALLLCGVL